MPRRPDVANGVRISQASHDALKAHVERLEQDLARMTADRNRLQELINSPVTADFLEGVQAEVAHQVIRGNDGKNHVDWLGTVCWLSSQAARAMAEGDRDRALHDTISTAAACANWHAHLTVLLELEPGPDHG